MCNMWVPRVTNSVTISNEVRFQNHKSAMNTKENTCEAAIHFNKSSRVLSDFSFIAIKQISNLSDNNKQLLDEVEHDIMNYQNRGLCYLPKPKAEADNTDTRF